VSLLPVDEALARLLHGVEPLPAETVPLARAAFRILAGDIVARRTQPPADVSAMDGYAVRAGDIARPPARLRIVGESAAGRGFSGTVGPGEAARIFTGAPVPPGADAILLQEDATVSGGSVEARESSPEGKHIRRAGLDFSEGETLLKAGALLDPAAVALAASADYPALPVIGQPRIAILMTGDELVAPGNPRGPDQIVASNGYGIAALAQGDGAEIIMLELVPDDRAAMAAAVRKAHEAGAEILVTIGGASVGDYDLVNQVLRAEGVEFDFWKIAMRPGKPLMVGRLGEMKVIGLPGNPVSSFVCSHLFLRPLIARLAGRAYEPPLRQAVLARPLGPNDHRRDYIRARLEPVDGGLSATAYGIQDSSMLRVLAEADGLIIREPHAPAAAAGETCTVHLMRLLPGH
jgi:molybdopterin molybdotransferase